MIKIDIKKELDGAAGAMQLDVAFSIKKGEFLAIEGASGSGKTTLLRILAGLEEAEGEIRVDDRVWLNTTTSLPPQQRGIGFLFQDYALFDNMSVLNNLLFVAKDRALAERLLALTDLTLLQHRYPKTLSGGQKQRVSLCRAMMQKPTLLLLDEPLSALHSEMRASLQKEILTLHNEFNLTTIMVSHDPSEIYKLASRVICLENGKIIKDGATKDILLQTNGSQKLSFRGELLSLNRVDVIYIAIVAIGQQLIEVVLSEGEIEGLEIGKEVRLSTKAFNPTLTPIV